MPGPARRPPTIASLLAVALVLALVAPTGCGSSTETALAIDDVAWSGEGRLTVTTECADDVRAEVDVDAGGSGLPRVTLWGVPRTGRCEPTAEVAVPPDATQLVDGTTSMVVDLPPPPP